MPKIAVIADFIEEKWPSMDLVAEELASHLGKLRGVESTLIRPPLRLKVHGRAPGAAERALGRFLQFPIELTANRPRANYYHIADHSYAHLALLFPHRDVGVYCHDIDAFRALLPGSGAPRSRKLLSRLLLRGLQHARVVFHSTRVVREEILRHGLVPESRLVHAPYGVAAEYLSTLASEPASRPYVLHVGSCIPRKNIEFLLQVFRAAKRRDPNLSLVQVGGNWTERQRAYLEEHGLATSVTQKRGISREELADLYARATVVLVPSIAEGFGLPIIEALACGAPVIASDIPVLREVGFDGVRFCTLGALESWEQTVAAALAAPSRVSQESRESVRTRYNWQAHATAVWSGYVKP